MGHHDLVGLVAVIGLFVIPSLALAGHLVVRPIVESILRGRPLPAVPPATDDERMTRIEDRVSQMQDSIDRLAEAVDFHMRLQAGTAAAPVGGPGPGQAQLPKS